MIYELKSCRVVPGHIVDCGTKEEFSLCVQSLSVLHDTHIYVPRPQEMWDHLRGVTLNPFPIRKIFKIK